MEYVILSIIHPSVRVYKWAFIGYFKCPEDICWVHFYCSVHPVRHRFWWQGLLDYLGRYLICLLKVKLPPIEKSKTHPYLPYPTLPSTHRTQPHQTLPALPLSVSIHTYSTTLHLPSSSTTPPKLLYPYPILPLLKLGHTLRFNNC